MKNIINVMKFTVNDVIRKKSFIISNIIILLIIFIGFNIPNILKGINLESGDSKIIIIDNDKVFNDELQDIKIDNYDIEILDIDITEAKKKVEKEDITGIYISKYENIVNLTYIVKNIFMEDVMPTDLLNALEKKYEIIELKKLGLQNEDIEKLNGEFAVSLVQATEEANGNIFAMMLMSIILFYAIYFCAYQVSSYITVEKTSKIIETLVTSTSPSSIVIGKTLGVGVVGLAQMIVYVIALFVCANIFIDKELLSLILDLSSITPALVIITFIYFILGYLVFSLLYALTGSTVSKPEDVQSANTPVALISVFSFYLSYFTMLNPSSTLNKFASLFPFSSPFCMPFRIMMGLTDVKTVMISIAILTLTIIVVAKISIKIYSNAIFNYGTKIGFKDIIRFYKQK